MQYGVLSAERAEELLVQINRRKGKAAGGGGKGKSPSKPAAKAAKKRKVEDATSVLGDTGLGGKFFVCLITFDATRPLLRTPHPLAPAAAAAYEGAGSIGV